MGFKHAVQEAHDWNSIQDFSLHTCSEVNERQGEKNSELILAHLELGMKIAWRLLSNWRIRLTSDDVVSIVGIALCEAASRFDPTKGAAFGTFLFYHVRGVLLKEITNAVNERRFFAVDPESESYHVLFNTAFYAQGDNPLVEHNTPERKLQQQELSGILNNACLQLDDLERTVVIRHYVHEEPLIDIAKDLDYCRCHISRVKTSAIQKLGEQLSSIADVAPEKQTKAGKLVKMRPRAKYTGGRGRRKEQNEVAQADVKKVA